jgi:hypothetical protein
MTAEGKLESKVEGPNSMRLSLKVDRDKLNAHESALVDGLFFGQRTETSTNDVRQHYKNSGFNPALVIKPPLDHQVKMVLPPGETRVRHWPSVVLYVAGLVLLASSSYSEPVLGSAAIAIAMISLFLVAILQFPGWLFRSRIDWGLKAAAFLLIPASVVSLGTAAFLWWYAGAGEVDLPWTMIAALTVLALGISNASIKGMKSGQSSAAIAFRKRLARGRSFFLKEIKKSKSRSLTFATVGIHGCLLLVSVSKLTSGPVATPAQRRTLPRRIRARATVRQAHLRRTRAGAEVAGSRAAQVQAGHGLRLRLGWRLESQRRVRAVAPVEVRAVPAEDRPVEAEAGDGRRYFQSTISRLYVHMSGFTRFDDASTMPLDRNLVTRPPLI